MSLERMVGNDAADDDYGSDTDVLLPERASAVATDRRKQAAQPYVVVMFTLLGTGCLTPWNSFAGALDFFGALLPHCDAASAFAVANFCANLLFLVIQLRFCKCFAPRAIIALVLYVGIMSYPLWLASAFYAPIPDTEEETVFLALVIGVGVAGAANAGLQVVVLALAGQMGSDCIGAFMNGQAVAGIITSSCRIMSKLLFEDHEPFEALRLSSILYFFSSVTVCTLCLWSWFALQRLPATKEARLAMSGSHSRRSSLSTLVQSLESSM
jgi:hypothetical protein